jgi:hypothetical protein
MAENHLRPQFARKTRSPQKTLRLNFDEGDDVRLFIHSFF